MRCIRACRGRRVTRARTSSRPRCGASAISWSLSVSVDWGCWASGLPEWPRSAPRFPAPRYGLRAGQGFRRIFRRNRHPRRPPHRHGTDRRCRRSAGDVSLQMLDLFGLRVDHRLDQIAERDDPDHRPVSHHREVADASVGTQAHAVEYIRVRAHGERTAGHDVGYCRLRRGFSLQDDLARVIAFGHHADQVGAAHHQQRADPMFGHLLDRLEYGCVRRDAEDRAALVLQQMFDLAHAWVSLRPGRRAVWNESSAGTDPACSEVVKWRGRRAEPDAARIVPRWNAAAAVRLRPDSTLRFWRGATLDIAG